MKRIILGISVLLMLIQNGFARSDAELDKEIANTKSETWKKIYHCEKAYNLTRAATSDVNICLKAIEDFKSKVLSILFLNTGVIYDVIGDDLNGYKYYMKSAKLGDIQAQKNLNIMCKESPWACK